MTTWERVPDLFIKHGAMDDPFQIAMLQNLYNETEEDPGWYLDDEPKT